MPDKTTAEIEALIKSGEIRAITMDTSIFDKFGCNLEYKSLTVVEQFKGKHIDFLLSPVTVGEVRSHIAKQVGDAREKASSGINQFLKSVRSKGELDKILGVVGLDIDPNETADEMVEAFIEKVGATIVNQQATSDELLALYFGTKPPFGKSAEKKSEFPDAIALLALEKWAEHNDTLILVVSRDVDWQSYAAGSEELICINDLSTALSLFNAGESVIAARIASAIKNNSAASLSRAIENRLESYIEDFDVEASAAYYYDYENNGAVVKSWEFEDSILVVDSDDDEVTLSFELRVEAEFEVGFSFSMRDSVDRDYISIGSTDATQRVDFSVTAVATFSKSNDRDPDPIDLEIEGRGVRVDFGEVGPEW
ncbi:PIN domain-containing protein [Rhizobium johnstonii]|uniref:PIN domain-containing protein n=1 Tax=Rhizobium johnstonii TaxID=3019933 RepID=UPI003F94F825